MDKISLPPFYVGQRVVYITGHNMPKDSVHTVRSIFQSPCGCWIVKISDESLQPHIKLGTLVSCNKCGGEFLNQQDSGYFSTSFRPLNEQKMPLMTFSEIKEVEQEKVLIMN